MDAGQLEARKTRARTWFERLRNDICAAFEAIEDDLPAGASYEGHIAATGCVPTRHNLHDFFNGAMWFQYPRVKAALNARQAAEIDARGIGPTRGRTRDALTLIDENAVFFASADPALSGARREFDWRALFIDGRAAWGHRCEARIFGHALLEKLVSPYKACTGHALIVDVPASYFSASEEERRAHHQGPGQGASAWGAGEPHVSGRHQQQRQVGIGQPGQEDRKGRDRAERRHRRVSRQGRRDSPAANCVVV